MNLGIIDLFSGKKWIILSILFFLIKRFRNAAEIDFKPYLHALKCLLLSWVCLILLGFTTWLLLTTAALLWLHCLMNSWLLSFIILLAIHLILFVIVRLSIKNQFMRFQAMFKR